MSNFENEKNAGSYPLFVRKLKNTVLRKETGSEFVLPDYMGDIKRVLKYTADAVPCNKIVSGDEASFLAVVTFRVTYLDSEDTLTEAVFTSDLEFAEKISENTDSADAEYKVNSVAVRLGGPRKISAKAIVCCEVCTCESEKICDHSEYDGAEMLKKEIEIHSAEHLKCAEREYAEELDKIDELSADDLEVVKSFAEAFIDAVHKTEGGVNLSGYVDAFCIIRSDEGTRRLEKRIPIEEHIECELYDNGIFIPMAYVTGMNVNLNNVNSEDACAVSVVMTMTVECGVTNHYNEKVSVPKDAFYEGCKNTCTYDKIDFSKLGECIYEKTPMSFSLARGEEPLYDIIEREINLKNPRCEIEGQDITVSSDGEIHMIARGNGPEDCYSIKEKIEFSKKYRINACESDGVYVDIRPCEVSVSFDSEKIYVEAQIIVSLLTESHEREEILSGVEYEKECQSGDRTVMVYYPEKEDTLWSVSKKYAVSPSSISGKNSIASDNLQTEIFGVGKIIIVK